LKIKASKLQFFNSLLLAGFIALFLSSCSFKTYETKPLNNEKMIDQIIEKDPESPSFKSFLNNQGINNDHLPIKEWGLKELILCALFFNPKIEIAKKEWDIAKIQEVVAPIKAASSLGMETGRQTTGTFEESKNAIGLNITTLFETADKAMIRQEKAINQSLVKRLELRKLAWDIKSELTFNFIRYQQHLLNLQILRNEIKNFNQIELNKNIQKLNEEQYQFNETKLKLASIIGLSSEKINTMRIATINLDEQIQSFNTILDDENKQQDIISLGLFNRIDLRIALAKYAVSESQLKLNIANQYPDIRFSPGYMFDYGLGRWLLGITSIIPTIEKNKYLVEEAKNLRDIEGLQIEKMQSSIVNEISKLRDNYTIAKDMVRKDVEDFSSAAEYEKSIESKFSQGEIDRLELTQQKLITMQYKRRFYTNKIALLKIGFDFESLLQVPLDNAKKI